MDYTVHGILQARIVEWVAVLFSRGSSQLMDQTQVSHICRQILYQLSHSEAEGGDHFQLVIDGVQASLDEHLQGKRKWGLGHL